MSAQPRERAQEPARDVRHRTLPLAAFLLLITGCWPDADPRLGVAVRLVDAAVRERAVVHPPVLATRDETTFPSQTSEAARIPTATIANDTRSVIATYPISWSESQDLRFDGSGSVRTALSLGPWAAAGGRVAVVTHVKPESSTQWEDLPAALVPVSGERAEVLFHGGIAYAGLRVALFSEVYPAPEDRDTRVELPPLHLPQGARLELSLGVLEAARDQGAVRFWVEACGRSGCSERFAATIDPLTREGARWRDELIDLTDLGDQEVSLRLHTRRVGAGAFSLPVWGDPKILAPAGSAEREAPSIVLLSIDTLRRDHLDVYGYPLPTAPFVRRLAGEGMVFEDLISEAATTGPSHMTMFTSLPTLVHGVRSVGNQVTAPLSTTAELLRERGYATAAITEDGPLGREAGFGLGFDRYVENKSPHLLLPEGHVTHTFDQVRAHLARVGGRPFFLFLHTFQVHAPYAPPAEYVQLFEAGGPGAAAEAMRSYDQEIRFVDDQIAALHEWMRSRGLLDNTYFFLVSDHGEQFYEHGMLGHGTPPFEEVLRVPLIVTGPGVPRGRNPTPLEHLDLLPTMLDLAGASIPATAQGRSFAPLLRGDSQGPRARPRVSASWALPAGFEAPAYAVRFGRWKLMRMTRDGERIERLYDLVADPEERNDVGDREPEQVEALALALDRYAWGSEQLAKNLRRGSAGASAREARRPPLDPDREAMLRALGYIE